MRCGGDLEEGLELLCIVGGRVRSSLGQGYGDKRRWCDITAAVQTIFMEKGFEASAKYLQ